MEISSFIMLALISTEVSGKTKNCAEVDLDCERLPMDCLQCHFPSDCKYGETSVVSCGIPSLEFKCSGPKNFSTQAVCSFCWQLSKDKIDCEPVINCSTTQADRLVRTTCEPKPQYACLGNRRFYRRVLCNYSKGYKWSTALILSITLGGFGADRFYLGMWREGLGKLFSFGGVGIWTLIDMVLIALGYIGPSDGSLYM